MRLLLDTPVFLWALKNDHQLNAKARHLIETAQEVYVSAASIWEMAIEISLKKLHLDLREAVEAIALSGFNELSITSEHAVKVEELPLLHRDPFDRLLIAQSLTEPLCLVTADNQLVPYSKSIIWVG